MATRRAIANGNWSATSTWNGGVLPGNGDTVYANGFNITLDTDVLIGGANNPIVNTGSIVSGQWYEIVNVGGQAWSTIGAASNTTGTVFLATGAGTAGNLGTALALATLTTATNTAAGATIGGGVFTMSTVRAINTNLRAGTTTCLNVTATSGTLTLSGLRFVGGSASGANGISTSTSTDISACSFLGGTNGAIGFNNASNGNVTINDSCTFTGGSGSASSNAFNNASNGVVTINGSCTFTGGSAGSSHALSNANGIINIFGSCAFTGGSNTSHALNNISGNVFISSSCTIVGGNTGYGLQNAGAGTITVSGSCAFTGGTGLASINNASTGTVIITNGTFTASAFANAVNITNTSGDVRLSGDFLDHWSGWKAVTGGKWRLGTTPTLGQTRYAIAGTTDSYYTMYGADNGTFGNPIAANVRSGVSYANGNLTGTCAVPAAGSVSLGVAVDAGFGTAVLTPAAIRSELSVELGRIDAAISSRLAPSGTLATVTTLTNAPSVPTPAQIASQVRTELSSELSKVAALNPTRLGQCTTTEILGNLLAQANS